MILKDSKSALSTAYYMLNQIEEKYPNYLTAREIPPELKVEIGMYIYLLRSSLDYAAYQIFETFCMQHVKNHLKQIKKKIQFPIISSVNFFEDVMDNFTNLYQNQPDIYKFIKSVQPIPNENWLSILNELSNDNKHRNLTRQKRIVENRMFRIGNIVITNPTIINPKHSDFHVNGVSFNLDDDGLPEIQHPDVDVTFDAYFVFSDLNVPVFPTLTELYRNTGSTIDTIETIMQSYL